MAVANPGTPNLAGNYGNIQQALEQSANIAGKDTGAMGAVAAAAAPVAERAVKVQDVHDKMGLEAFKGSIEDQLNKNSAIYKAQTEGSKFYTNDDIKALIKNGYGDLPDKYIPDVGDGVWLKPGDLQALAEHGEFNAQAEKLASSFDKTDPNKATLIRLLSKDKNNTPYMAMLGGAGKIHYQVDASTGFHVPINQMGQVVGPPLEHAGGVYDASTDSAKIDDYSLLAPVQKRAVEKVVTKAASDSAITGVTKKLDTLEQMKQEVATNNPTAITNVRANLAQAIGNVPGGRFSSNLLQQEGFSKSLADTVDQWLTTKGSGKLSTKNQQLILQQIDDNMKVFKTQVSKRVSGYVSQAKNASGNSLSDKGAYKAVSANFADYMPSSTPAPTNDGGQVPTVTSQEEYAAIPSGGKYTYNGTTYTKK